jgi:hypothetical protein
VIPPDARDDKCGIWTNPTSYYEIVVRDLVDSGVGQEDKIEAREDLARTQRAQSARDAAETPAVLGTGRTVP